MMSVAPPAANGTMIFIGRFGIAGRAGTARAEVRCGDRADRETSAAQDLGREGCVGFLIGNFLGHCSLPACGLFVSTSVFDLRRAGKALAVLYLALAGRGRARRRRVRGLSAGSRADSPLTGDFAVASSPTSPRKRGEVKRTAFPCRHTLAISRRDAPEVCVQLSPESEGQECGRRSAAAARGV